MTYWLVGRQRAGVRFRGICLLVLATATALAVLAPRALGQNPTLPARVGITVRVIDSRTKLPIVGAELVVGGRSAPLRTSDSGSVSLTDVAPIDGMPFRVRKVGFAMLDTIVRQSDLAKGAIVLSLLRVEEIAPVNVIDSAPRRLPVYLQEFEDRRRTAPGRFYSPEQLRSADARGIVRLSSALRSLGYIQRFIRPNCRPQIILDGHWVSDLPERFEFADTHNYDAVEYYADPVTTPAKWSGPKAVCGTLVIWSRLR